MTYSPKSTRQRCLSNIGWFNPYWIREARGGWVRVRDHDGSDRDAGRRGGGAEERAVTPGDCQWAEP